MSTWIVTLTNGPKLGLEAGTYEVAKKIANDRGYKWTSIEEAKSDE